MKKIIPLIICLMLVGCSASEPKLDACSSEQACDATGSSPSSELVPISFDEAIDYFTKKKTGLLYFGFKDCPWCQEAVPILEEVANEDRIEIQYIQTRNEEKELLYSEEQKEQIQPFIQEYMSQNEEGDWTLYVPLVVVVNDGKVVAGHVGTVDGHDAHERQMTEQERDELKEIYRSMLGSFDKQD